MTSSRDRRAQLTSLPAPSSRTAAARTQLLENIERAFESENGAGSDATEREAELLQKIGELTVERDFLLRGLERLK